MGSPADSQGHLRPVGSPAARGRTGGLLLPRRLTWSISHRTPWGGWTLSFLSLDFPLGDPGLRDTQGPRPHVRPGDLGHRGGRVLTLPPRGEHASASSRRRGEGGGIPTMSPQSMERWACVGRGSDCSLVWGPPACPFSNARVTVPFHTGVGGRAAPTLWDPSPSGPGHRGATTRGKRGAGGGGLRL